ncbi:zinc finger protein with KRAB and SCAN domains 3 [Myxocyprinus asiaticus]|uniref:zinc finger protein with KRAB and SCAN domains 3 n=1 Tax=Myxocyprinus asiaticus TaxID=70543 RepID=UPI002223B4A5|nr:zinc finger protein with KRAB and SCAN domains 3 [Myxocyprinus asiaticus]
MNGALYISFFQGQLESALEQVVQLAVQEITKTVGATLNSMLLETATKEQENLRLRATLQSRELKYVGKGKSNASKGRKDTNDGTKQRTPSQSTECGMQSETLRREQKGRAVGQLKAVMEHVLEFAICELTKIVEDSFDDLLVEFTKKERENQILKEQLQDKDNEVVAAETEDCENDSDSPSSSKVERQESQGVPDQSSLKKAWEKEQTETTNEADKQAVIAVAQDWVPILDKVFGQKWCSDLFQIKEVTTSKEECTGLGSGPMSDMNSLIRETLMPSCLASQRKLELEVGQLPWLQAEDMEVVSLSSDTKGIPVVSSTGDNSLIRSPSMLQRLLTLPSQLLEDDEQSMDAAPSLEVSLDPSDSQVSKGPKSDQIPANKIKEQKNLEEDDDEDETRAHELDERESSKHKGRRKSHACNECGRKFSRMHLLKAHQQTHEEMPNQCPQCGKSFSQSSKLQAHLRTHTGKTI